MRYEKSLLNPAGTAIAAVLALAPLGAVAQTVEGAQPPPVVSSPPITPTTAAPTLSAPIVTPSTSSATSTTGTTGQPVFAPQSPVVQQVPAEPSSPVAEDINSDTSSPKAARPTAKTVNRTAASTDARPASTAKAASSSPADEVSEANVPVQPVTDVSPTMAAPQIAETAPESAKESANNSDPASDDSAAWALGLGALALVGGAGLIAMMNRRRRSDDVVVERDVAVSKLEPVPVTPPIIKDQPVTATEAVMVERPKDVVKEDALSQQATTNIAGSRETTDKPLFSQFEQGEGSLQSRREAMIADAPSAENPFRTRKNRLRRANFILRQDAFSGQNETSIARNSEMQTASAADKQTRPELQTSYRFSSGKRPAPAFRPKYN